VKHLFESWRPIELLDFVKSWVWRNEPVRLSEIGKLSLASQLQFIAGPLGLVAAPVVIVGFWRELAHKHAGKVAFCIYLVPTLIIALVYRMDRPFSHHVILLYHTIILFLWVSVLHATRSRGVLLGLTMIGLEGIICV